MISRCSGLSRQPSATNSDGEPVEQLGMGRACRPGGRSCSASGRSRGRSGAARRGWPSRGPSAGCRARRSSRPGRGGGRVLAPAGGRGYDRRRVPPRTSRNAGSTLSPGTCGLPRKSTNVSGASVPASVTQRPSSTGDVLRSTSSLSSRRSLLVAFRPLRRRAAGASPSISATSHAARVVRWLLDSALRGRERAAARSPGPTRPRSGRARAPSGSIPAGSAPGPGVSTAVPFRSVAVAVDPVVLDDRLGRRRSAGSRRRSRGRRCTSRPRGTINVPSKTKPNAVVAGAQADVEEAEGQRRRSSSGLRPSKSGRRSQVSR